MTNEQRERITTMRQGGIGYIKIAQEAQIMLKNGIIDKYDIVSIEHKLAEKYGLKIGSIYREIDLITVAFRANMV